MDALRPLFVRQEWCPAHTASHLSDAISLPDAPRSLAVDAVVFDTVDVLFDATYWPRKLMRLVNRLGVSACYDEFMGRWKHDFLAEVCRGRRDYDEAFQSFLLGWGLSWAQIDEIEADGRVGRGPFPQDARPLPGVVRTLQSLCERGFRLAAWADACESAERIVARLARMGLPDVFDSVLCSFDLEATQPDAQCYRACIAVLNRPAGAIAYVGHDAAHLAAARTAGLVTVAFNHSLGTTADFHLTSIDELLSVLATPATLAADKP